ncbi:uncharacterized protein RJT20DRAFT_58386 [Scheffersomyces xylosifermentans]|uniref:uncharacterized protein n=1 Tax=Scheffersomyces xylosifermentans TaxID=1304137 RepID=UPI00315DDED8
MSAIFRRIPDSDRNIRASLYFGNLDPEATELLMYELFIQFAPIRYLNMPKDRILKTHQGFGFVEFKTVRDADYTLEILRGVRLFGKILKLKKAEPPKTGSQHQDQQVGSTSTPNQQELLNPNYIDIGAKLFVNNLNPLIDDQFLKETFSKFGTLIKNPVLKRDPETGESKGYGFLTFDDFSTCDEIIEKMDGAILMNAKINVSYAFKEDPATGQQKRSRHGDKVERLLAESAKSNNVLHTKKKNPVKKSGKVTKPSHNNHARRTR